MYVIYTRGTLLYRPLPESLCAPLQNASYDSGGNQTEWDDDLASSITGSELQVQNVC